MNKRLRRIILFGTAVLALGTIGSTTASVDAMHINTLHVPVNQYVVKHESKIIKQMPKDTRYYFNLDEKAIFGEDHIFPCQYKVEMGYLLLHPKINANIHNGDNDIDMHIYANGNQFKNGYRNYFNSSNDGDRIYAKPDYKRHNRIIANKRTVERLANNYVPFRVLRKYQQPNYGDYYDKIRFKSGLTGWINDGDSFSFNSYSKIKSYLSAYYGYIKACNTKNKKVNNKIMSLINNSAYNVYRNHYRMNKVAKRDLAKATEMINRYKRIYRTLRYNHKVYMNAINEAKKGRIATKFGRRFGKRFEIISSKKATLYNVRHARLVK